MKTRILTAIAFAIALPAVAQASDATSAHFAAQRESLNIEQTAQYHALPTRYSVDTVIGGHSAAAGQALENVADATQLATSIPASNNSLIGEGQSDAAAQALQNAAQFGDQSQGSIEMSFASNS